MPRGVYERPSEENRFLKYVNKTENCWEWTAALDEDGYGRFTSPERRAHRFAYRFYKEPIGEGLLVLHDCDNRKCCNPAHLRLGTEQDNADDCKKRGRTVASSASFKPGQQIGEGNLNAKLTLEKVRAIRKRYNEGLRYGELKTIAEEYGIKYVTIQKIVHNKLWIEPEIKPENTIE